MRVKGYFCGRALGLLVLAAGAQAQTVKSQDLLTKIKSGDAAAMLEGGRQKEFAVIPLLKEQLSGPKSGAALWAIRRRRYRRRMGIESISSQGLCHQYGLVSGANRCNDAVGIAAGNMLCLGSASPAGPYR